MAKPKSRINLYRPTMGAQSARGPKNSWWLLVVILFVLSAGVRYALELKQAWQLGQEIKAKQAERDRLRSELDGLGGQLKLLTSGVTSQVSSTSVDLLQIINQRTAWLELFQEVSVRVPDGVWLLRVEVETMKLPKGKERATMAEKKTIVLAGFARSQQIVGQLLSALEQSPRFSSVSLKFAEERSEKAGEQVNFEIHGLLL